MSNYQVSPHEAAEIDHDLVRVFIVGRQDYSLDGLASMLAAQEGDYKISCAEPDQDCLQKLETAQPHVLLIQNESLPHPFDRMIHQILQVKPDIRILVFGKNMTDDHLYSLVRAGIHGYINERMGGEHFKRALDHVLKGGNWIERHILERFVAHQQQADDALEVQFYEKVERLCGQLTKRETEILCEVVKGLTIKEIAEQVHLSHQGVKMHLAKLFKKFHVGNRNQLILAAFDEMIPIKDLSGLLRKGLSLQLQGKISQS
jgi:DNA-binding NarL/FixJ family response regulator